MNHRTNNFDALRLLGALLVAVSHSATIVLSSEPLGDATGNQTLGGVGLNIFCVISGFLITKSRLSNPAPRFFRARALRIFPALFVAIPLMAFVLGPLFTSLSTREYFSTGQTWQFLGTMFVFPLNVSLPGVFGGAPLVGQLYSLTAELSFYILVGLLAPWRHFGKLMIAATVAVLLYFHYHDYTSLSFSEIISVKGFGANLFFFPLRLGMTCVYYLFAGSVIALYIKRPERLAWLAPALLAAWIAALFLPNRLHYDLAEMLIFPFLVIGVALSTKFIVRIPRAFGDTSYGIYIYHFAIAEAVLTLTVAHIGRTWYLIAIAVALSTAVAWISFRLIEKPALSIKDRSPGKAVNTNTTVLPSPP
ncbi:acyltransferase family protein [Pseudomonas sp. PDM22]|uniref:acyltransferase family protein n=1 Tax=Pseudomonas sp. PDM22 TaxID=2769287 RepID=UPI0009DB1504|nr:acyltransferase [Pseudomonas sp. PDM22]MBD9515428.1 acyltransferase [Pseudomonas sp. PDM22]OQR38173.1 hypothetical protein BWR15_01280 [Pseudomonas sp. T]